MRSPKSDHWIKVMDERRSHVEAAHEPRTRRHHTRSRKGCGVCKRRKIKCDEGKPTCANCARHGVKCDFPSAATVATLASVDSASVSQLTSTLTPDQTPGQTDGRTSKNAFDSILSHASGQMSSLELIHLELLHNYTTLTSQTLSGDPVLKNVWRINVPKVGFSNDFVMRSIFALSALHMSLFSTNRRQFYLNVARSEHGAALHEIASILSHVTAENCSAVYIAAALTFFYAWAHPRQPGDFFLVSSSGTAEWVFLLQGVRSISESWRTELRNGPFSPMFRLGNSRIEHLGSNFLTSTAWLSTVEHAQLTYLRRIVAQAATDARTSAIYQENIENLETCFCAVFCSSHSLSQSHESSSPLPYGVTDGNLMPVTLTSNVYSWLYKIDDCFIDLLNQRDPLALVIFAHFCILLKLLGSCWWMQGWSTHLLQEIWDLLDEEHRLWIRWPIEEIGWRPRA